MLSLYLHIPFCQSRCRYCDFYSETGRESEGDRLIAAMCQEWDLIRREELAGGRPDIESIYFGGGTPSLLKNRQIAPILSRILKDTHWNQDLEITIEGNPESITKELAAGWRSQGINRVSLGVQSFDDNQLRRLGRIHTARKAMESIEILKSSGFHRLSIDLLFGIDPESSQSYRNSLECACRIDPGHLSCYLLTIEKGTPLQRLVDSGEWRLADDEISADDFEWTRSTLSERGYEPYEISNFARNGQRSIHNERYWRREPYIGLGPGAHSFLKNRRMNNHPHLGLYLDSLLQHHQRPIAELKQLTQRQITEEEIFLGLRRKEGIHWRRFAGGLPSECRMAMEEKIEAMVRGGFLHREQGRVALAEKAIFISNAVIVELIHVLDEGLREPASV